MVELGARALGKRLQPVPLDDLRTGHPGSPPSTPLIVVALGTVA